MNAADHDPRAGEPPTAWERPGVALENLMDAVTDDGAGAISADTLLRWLEDGREIALVDIREEGLFGEGHLLLAVNIPYSRLELDAPERVPRPATRVVLIAEDGRAPLARRRLAALGYGAVSWLEGGNAGWEAAGQPLFAGVNVPSKAFAECVEQTCHTPDIEASELDRLRRENADVVVLDTRTREEFGRFHVPGAISVPGSEVVRRFDEVVTSEDTFVVVSCAGRTRGIIGAQALIDAGVPNRIAVLSGGTQGWRLAGLTLERDTPAIAPRALADGLRELARTRTGRLAARSGIGAIDRDELARWRADADRTTYLFDVRSPEEYAEGHGEGFVSAQGGQLVQSLDHWVATRGARIVLTDDDGIRSTMTAHWLRQLGWEVGVLPGFVTGKAPASGHPAPRPRAGVRHLDAGEVRDWIAAGALPLCADPSGLYRQAHPAGAGWINRARLKRIVAGAQGARRLIVTAHEIGLAELVALDLAEATGEAVAVYPGSRASWSRAGLATEASPDSPPDRERIDFLFWLHDRHSGNLEASRAYLDWELGLPAAVGDRRQTRFEIGPTTTA